MSEPGLARFRWPSLARDLAVMLLPDSPLTDIRDVRTKYNVSEEELRTILVIPYFQELFRDAVDYFKAQGNKAGTRFRAAILSDSLAEKLYTDAMQENMKSQDAIKLLELLLKTSGALEKETTTVATQVNVGVSLPLPRGLKNPKLNHVLGSVNA